MRRRGNDMGIRTDLAIENKEIYDSKNPGVGGEKVEIPGVKVKENIIFQGEEGQKIKAVRIEIETDEGSRLMEKPPGTYITVEVDGLENDNPDFQMKDEHTAEAGTKFLPFRERIIQAVAAELTALLPFTGERKILIIGLGNEKVTPDSLGPVTLRHIKVTRHMFLLMNADRDEVVSCTSALAPGVMATTGMETAELIQGAVEITKPDVVIAVDALAARNLDRISRTVQINDVGVSPGSGTGNMRKNLTKESLGVPVIAVGVPTVIDSRTLIMDSLEKAAPGVQNMLSSGGNAEAWDTMIVTVSDIDRVVEDFGYILGDAINRTVHPGLIP